MAHGDHRPAQRPPALLILTTPTPAPAQAAAPCTTGHSPARSANSPFRYVQLPPADDAPQTQTQTQAAAGGAGARGDARCPTRVEQHPLSGPAPGSAPPSPSSSSSSPTRTHSGKHAPPLASPLGPAGSTAPHPHPAPLAARCRGRPRGLGTTIPARLQPWLGIGSWAATSIGFLVAIAFWKKEVFTGLDQLSLHLQSLGSLGYAVLFCFIFITTIPPFPLYSTLIILSGYTFGVWTGAAISYLAALSGAVVVFLLSRRYLRDGMSRVLAHTQTLRRVVRAVEKRPTLLLLIRVAPYPYNLMNVLLAASHTLSFTTYFCCTALSLVKVVVHTSIGNGIHSFAGYHAVAPSGMGRETDNGLGRIWTVSGIILCFAIFVYLSYVARRAVDEELEDEGLARAEEGGCQEMREVILSP